MSIESLMNEDRLIAASTSYKQQSTIPTTIYQDAEKDRLKFWEKQAQNLHWFKQWDTVLEWSKPYAKWFQGGQLNAAYNCLDVHLNTEIQSKTALIWEGELGQERQLTYQALHQHVCRFASVLKSHFNIKKGDRITLYMPMIPELVIAVLACARIGAIHSVVFGGFSLTSLRDRIEDSGSKLVITADGCTRRGTQIPLKSMVDQALLDHCPTVESVVVVRHLHDAIQVAFSGRDYDYHSLMESVTDIVAPEHMDSEDPLFILYTSGTTGKPKGIIHTTGGYLTHAKYSTQLVFDLQDHDVYWCTADVGWITGHTYLIYGPLSNGATVFMFEGTPDYPDKDRFWSLIEKYKVSVFYTAPTAIRAFMKWGTQYITSYNLSSLRLLGTVGEPINPEAWMWYYTHIGQEKCPIVDTWWQTETGGIMVSNLPALNDMKPGSAGLPLPGISTSVLDDTGALQNEGGGYLSITEPWPSMLRGIWGDSNRYQSTYWDRFDTYFAGDGAIIDTDHYLKVLGRVDDVLNVAGHRIGTMEVESALVDHKSVAEAAVVGINDEIKGQAIMAFVILKESEDSSAALVQTLIDHVSSVIGPIAKPKTIVFTPELPKTRSGKIMRRILKDIADGTPIGDVTTLANPNTVESLLQQVNIKL